MIQHHRLVCGGLFFFFTVAHAGCAGSGLKNMFTRNETDGYHSLDELDARERAIAKTEESEDESKPASVVSRLTSWRPFSKDERVEEDAYAAETHNDVKDSSESSKSTRFLGRAFARGEAVDPDPFLESESASIKRQEESAFKAGTDQQFAKTDKDTGKADIDLASADDELTVTPHPKNKSTQHADSLATADSKKPGSSASGKDDDALAKRFEQHFLLNAGAKTDAKLTTTAKNLQDNTAGVAANVNSKRRDLSSIAERQIDSFDSLMGSADSNYGSAGFKRTPEAEPLRGSQHRDSAGGAIGNSLAAFDSLMGTEGKVATGNVIDAAHKVTHKPETKTAALEINVADAASLFGDAVARQNARGRTTETAEDVASSASEIAVKGGWTEATEDENAFQWNNPRDAKAVPRANIGDYASNALGRHKQANLNSSQGLDHGSEFGAPPAASANIEDDNYSGIETADARLSNESVFGTNRRTPTAASGIVRPRAVIIPASSESIVGGNTHFTVAPAPESGSGDSVAVASNRPGLLQSLSIRNWLLLIGGIIVIALLFAPGRTKHTTMTNRPANG